MPLSRIEHFLVAADDIEKTGKWYRRVPGMKTEVMAIDFARS